MTDIMIDKSYINIKFFVYYDAHAYELDVNSLTCTNLNPEIATMVCNEYFGEEILEKIVSPGTYRDQDGCIKPVNFKGLENKYLSIDLELIHKYIPDVTLTGVYEFNILSIENIVK